MCASQQCQISYNLRGNLVFRLENSKHKLGQVYPEDNKR